MIGLEFILNHYNIKYIGLAKELNIKKQNISMWITGQRKIPKKYVEALSRKFNVGEDFLQSELEGESKYQYKGKNAIEYLHKSITELPVIENTLIVSENKPTDLSKVSNNELIAEIVKRKIKLDLSQIDTKELLREINKRIK